MFSENSKNIKKVQNETSSGAFVVNETIMQMANNHLPFGGVGQSGYGRYHGKTGFVAFSNPRSICKTKAVNPYPLSCRFPPYTDQSKSLLLKLMKVGVITYDDIFKLVFGLIIVIVLIVLLFHFVWEPTEFTKWIWLFYSFYCNQILIDGACAIGDELFRAFKILYFVSKPVTLKYTFIHN